MDSLLMAGQPIWRPMVDEDDPSVPTPQRRALDSLADFLFYGGAAGGGKTDLLIGTALTAHRRSIIYRREFKQLAAIEDRCAEMLGSRKGYNSTNKIWRLAEGRQLEFGACQHPGDEQAYQGRPHDLKCFDEITHFHEHQFRFLGGWLRTTVPGQRQRVIAAGNPPTNAEGDWVLTYWAPWLDETHAFPALPGELRWFAMIDGADRELEDESPFDYQGDVIVPKSRSFIPSRVEDNPYLMRTGYRAQLQALPEPLRSQMLKGAFDAGLEDEPGQVIPTAWVKAAQARWEERPPARVKMDTIGVDPARGGQDETVLSPRCGVWFAEQVTLPGTDTPDGPSVVRMVVTVIRDRAQVNVDAIGVGTSVVDHLRGAGVRTHACVGSNKSVLRDRSGSIGFFNRRAEWWWRFRESLDPEYGENLALPPDRQLRSDLCSPRWSMTSRGIRIEEKEEIVKRLGRSPDRGEAAVYALVPPDPTTDYLRSRSAHAESAYDPHAW